MHDHALTLHEGTKLETPDHSIDLALEPFKSETLPRAEPAVLQEMDPDPAGPDLDLVRNPVSRTPHDVGEFSQAMLAEPAARAYPQADHDLHTRFMILCGSYAQA